MAPANENVVAVLTWGNGWSCILSWIPQLGLSLHQQKFAITTRAGAPLIFRSQAAPHYVWSHTEPSPLHRQPLAQLGGIKGCSWSGRKNFWQEWNCKGDNEKRVKMKKNTGKSKEVGRVWMLQIFAKKMKTLGNWARKIMSLREEGRVKTEDEVSMMYRRR